MVLILNELIHPLSIRDIHAIVYDVISVQAMFINGDSWHYLSGNGTADIYFINNFLVKLYIEKYR